MFEQITKDTNAVFTQLIETAKLHEGSIVVLGCSTSEVGGDRIGTHSSMDIAAAIYDGFFDMLKESIRLPEPFFTLFNIQQFSYTCNNVSVFVRGCRGSSIVAGIYPYVYRIIYQHWYALLISFRGCR